MTRVGLVQINWDLNWGHAESISDSNDEVEYSLLPYSVGMLQAHAQRYATQADQLRWRTPIFSRGPTTTAADKLGDVDIVAFSAYVWNIEASLDLARNSNAETPFASLFLAGLRFPIMLKCSCAKIHASTSRPVVRVKLLSLKSWIASTARHGWTFLASVGFRPTGTSSRHPHVSEQRTLPNCRHRT